MSQASLFTASSSATFSPCRAWRYTLTRRWGEGPPCNFLMLNPSTADESANDPTVERCERRARAWGYPGLVVTNLFAFRATDPVDMRAAADPVGPANDAVILKEARAAGIVICAWGNDGAHLGRSASVVNLLRTAGIPLHLLRMNGTGEPAHPLYLSYSLKPVPWLICLLAD